MIGWTDAVENSVLTRNIRIPTLLLLLGGTALVAPHSVTQQQLCELCKLCDTAATVQLCNCVTLCDTAADLQTGHAGSWTGCDSDKIMIDLLRIYEK